MNSNRHHFQAAQRCAWTQRMGLWMHGRMAVLALAVAFGMVGNVQAQPPPGKSAKRLAGRAEAALEGLKRREWTLAGTAREALVHVPAEANKEAAPVVFAFHGH